KEVLDAHGINIAVKHFSNF
ncbi:hypothetical protein A2U01_0094540, partial [Trifolium medium]|nr:hypothetical protein [Trifolium medium]